MRFAESPHPEVNDFAVELTTEDFGWIGET